MRIAQRRVGGQLAEDFAQASILALLLYERTNVVLHPFRALARIVIRRCDDHWRRDRREMPVDPCVIEDLIPTNSASADVVYEPLTVCGMTIERLARGRRQRTIVDHLLRGESLSAAAFELGIPVREARRIADKLSRRLAKLGSRN